MTLHTETINLHPDRGVTLVKMLQTTGGEFGAITQRPAVLILPGGAYAMCSAREAEPVAYPYLAAGYHAFVLRYSVGEHYQWPRPLNDYEEAMELIRSHADEWNVCPDKIAVIGFSAGGHLAGCSATMAKNRPNAAILGYAALDDTISSALQPSMEIASPIRFVDKNTPPCFLFASREDNIVPVISTVKFEEALIQYGIQFESHIYAYGGHGYSTGEENLNGSGICRRVPNWVRDSIGWLEDIFGHITNAGLSEPVCGSRINGDFDDYLNVNCTIAYLDQQEAAAPVFKPIIDGVNSVLSSKLGRNFLLTTILGNMTLKDVMHAMNMPEERIAEIDKLLKQIPNHI